MTDERFHNQLSDEFSAITGIVEINRHKGINSSICGLETDTSLLSPSLGSRIQIGHWREEKIEIPHLDPRAQRLRLPHLSKLRTPKYHIIGMSPSCHLALALQDSSLTLYTMRPNPIAAIHQLKFPKQETVKDVTLSDAYAVMTLGSQLSVLCLRHHQEVKERFPTLSDGTTWTPRRTVIYDTHDRSWIAVAGETFSRGTARGDICIYKACQGEAGLMLRRHRVSFETTKEQDHLRGALINYIDFSPDGGRLLCLTNCNRVLVWFMSINARPKYAPFTVLKPYRPVCLPRSDLGEASC